MKFGYFWPSGRSKVWTDGGGCLSYKLLLGSGELKFVIDITNISVLL